MTLNIEPSFLWFAVATLATWRLTYFLYSDSGPWNLFALIRHAAKRLHLGAVFECPYCLSVWISLIVVIVTFGINARIFLLWFGVAGGAAVIIRFQTSLTMLIDKVASRAGKTA
jgi:hypothetical protein